MIKSDIVNLVSDATGLTKVETETVLDGFLHSITSSLERGEKVEIRGFGSFVVKKRNAREARNPATNEVVNLEDRYIPSFKVSKILKKKVNKSILENLK
ncbi:MAG: integration host factor subunit beta [Candidatus Marinimicrobia bacterium]|nr:integration host factor subunit beta [Candidatus Neomarinimicrobiota bacterium]